MRKRALTTGTAAALALSITLASPPARACPDGPGLPEVLIVLPVALALFPVSLAASGAFGAVMLTSGMGGFVATLPLRVRDPARANQLTQRAFRAPLTALERLLN